MVQAVPQPENRARAPRRRTTNAPGSFTTDPGDNFFYLTDVMFSVRGVTNGAGVLHTRLDYTPYGVAMRSPAVDVTGDGLVDVFDLSAFMTVYSGGPGGTALKPGDTGYDPDADLSGSGDLGFFDFLAFQAMYGVYGPGGTAPAFNGGWIDNPNDEHGPDNSVGYDGYWFDLAGATEATSTGLYMVRHRVYDPKLGRWVQRDPVGYIDGMLLMQYAISAPVIFSDPSGLAIKGTDKHASRFVLGMAKGLCPEGNWKLKDGKLVPGDDSFCEPTEEPIGGWGCSRPTRTVPRGADSSSRPITCGCLCDAVNDSRTLTVHAGNTPPGQDPSDGGYVLLPGYTEIFIGPGRPGGYPGDYSDPSARPDHLPPDRVKADQRIIFAHELCGHAVPQTPHPTTPDRYTDRDPVIILENQIRHELGPQYGTRR